MTSFFKVTEDSWFDDWLDTAPQSHLTSKSSAHASQKQFTSDINNNMGPIGDTKTQKVEHFQGWPNDIGVSSLFVFNSPF